MSGVPNRVRTAEPWPPLAVLGVLGAILGTELVFLLTRFSAADLAGSPHAWVRALAGLRIVPQIVLGAATAAWLISRERMRGQLVPLLGRPRDCRAALPFLVAHLGAFGVLHGTTSMVLTEARPPATQLALWCLWAAAVVATVGLGMLAGFPLRAWLRLVRHSYLLWLAVLGIGFGAWFAGDVIAHRLWLPLSHVTFTTASALFGLFADRVITDDALLEFGTSQFLVRVAPSCSGLEGIGLTLVFVASYLWALRRSLRWPQAWLLLPIATVLVWAANLLRLVGLVAVGSWISADAAEEGFHSIAGTLAFCVVTLGTVAVTRRMRFFMLEVHEQDEAVNETAAHLAPFLAVVATVLVTEALAPGAPALYGLRLLAAGTLLLLLRRGRPRFEWSWSWHAALLGAAAFAVWLALGAHRDDGLHGGGAIPASRPEWFWLAVRTAGSICVLPFVEELAFRGYLIRRLQSVDFSSLPLGRGTPMALVVSSLAFGALHPHWVAGTFAGVIYALALDRRGRLGDAVFAHAVTNALLVGHALWTNDRASMP